MPEFDFQFSDQVCEAFRATARAYSLSPIISGDKLHLIESSAEGKMTGRGVMLAIGPSGTFAHSPMGYRDFEELLKPGAMERLGFKPDPLGDLRPPVKKEDSK